MFIRSKSGDMVNYAKALNQLGNAENYLGHYEHAIQIFTEMITIMTAVSNEREVDQAHYNLGLTHYFLGMYDEAYDDFQSMFNYGLRVGDVNNMTLAINGLAMARNEQGNYAEAMEWCLRALDECNKFDEWYAKVYLSQTLGQAYLHMNMFEKAKCAFAEGLELGLARGLVPGILHNMLGWACYYIQIGRDLDYARLLLQQVVAHRGSIHFSRTRAQALLATMPAQPTARPTSPNATIAELADLAREVGVL
jgi:tetratricopeptide (TPR) repeat protein